LCWLGRSTIYEGFFFLSTFLPILCSLFQRCHWWVFWQSFRWPPFSLANTRLGSCYVDLSNCWHKQPILVWWFDLFFPLLRLSYYFFYLFGNEMSSSTTSTSRTNFPIFSNHIASIENMDGLTIPHGLLKSGYDVVNCVTNPISLPRLNSFLQKIVNNG